MAFKYLFVFSFLLFPFDPLSLFYFQHFLCFVSVSLFVRFRFFYDPPSFPTHAVALNCFRFFIP